ncbi:MAG: hypothetical protein HYU80_02490 [Candidatus Blackburnbacteria bacterium]|nr:hypothetical protein [Candidatus Blackburnbacteria bacterium]
MPRDSGPAEPADLLSDGGSSSRDKGGGITHETIYDRERGTHISWDHDKDGDYISGSGHTRDDRAKSTISDWDQGRDRDRDRDRGKDKDYRG